MKLKTHKTGIAVFIGTVLLIALAVMPVLAQRAGGGPGGAGRPGLDGPGPMAFMNAPDRPGFPRMGPQDRRGAGERFREHRQHFPGKMLLTPMARQRLGLSDDQVGRIREMTYETRKREIQLDSEQKLAQLDLEQLLSAEEPNRGAINAQIERVGTIEIQKRQLAVNRNLDLREVLTKDQREKIEKFREDMTRSQLRDRQDRPGAERPGREDRRPRAQQERPLREDRERQGFGPQGPRPERAPEPVPPTPPSQP